MYSDIYKREKKVQTEDLKKKKYLLQPLGTVATVQNWKEKKKKVANQNGTVDEQ